MCVDTIAFLLCLAACKSDGIKYANDFPTPVPASTMSGRLFAKASATATAISCCCGRYSNPSPSDIGPSAAKNACMRSGRRDEPSASSVAKRSVIDGRSPFMKSVTLGCPRQAVDRILDVGPVSWADNFLTIF